MLFLRLLSILAATRWLYTSRDVTLPKDLFCLRLIFVSRFHCKLFFFFFLLRSDGSFRYNNVVISCFDFKEERRRICQGIRHSGPLPCSSAFSGNIGCLAGVQWTWSGQHQAYDLLAKHQYTRSNRRQSQKLSPKYFFFGRLLVVCCLVTGYGDDLP